MVSLGGTPQGPGRHPTKAAHPVEPGDMPLPVGNVPKVERIWKALVDRGCSQRQAMKMACATRWEVRSWTDKWEAMGWIVKLQRGGVRPTEKAPKTLRKGWAATPTGSPLQPPAPYVHRVGDPSRLHRGKLMGNLDRSVNAAGLEHWEGSKPNHQGVIYHKFVVPCKTSSGLVGVPIQIIQPKRLDRDMRLIVQSANIMAREATIVDLGREGTLQWVLEAMTGLVRSWLRGDAQHLDGLRWVGLENEDLEVAQEALPGAKVGGDPQRDFVAVDKSDTYTPFHKEEEQNLTAFIRLRQLEKTVEQMEAGQDRLATLLDRIGQASTEQIDQLAAIAEQLARKGNQ